MKTPKTLTPLLTIIILACSASPALAQSAWWHLSTGAIPSYLPPAAENEEGVLENGKGEIVVTAANLGDADVDGATSPVTIADTLPKGLTVVSITGLSAETDVLASCTKVPLSCTFAGNLPPYHQIEVVIGVEVQQGAQSSSQSGEDNQASVSSAATATVTASSALTISAEPTPFGLQDNELQPDGMAGAGGGEPDLQAGSHPFQLTDTIVLNQYLSAELKPTPVALTKNVDVKLPTGFVGNPAPFARCTLAQFLAVNANNEDDCPAQTAVGVATVHIDEPSSAGDKEFVLPVFNVEPSYGEPARFGFFVPEGKIPVFIDTSVRGGPGTGEAYALSGDVENISQTAGFLSSEVTFWGVPGEAVHDNSRGWNCINEARGAPSGPCQPLEAAHPPSFLTMPTSCPEMQNPSTHELEPEPLQSSVEMDSWAQAGKRREKHLPPLLESFAMTQPLQALDGCNTLAFKPTMQAEPTTDSAASPSGLAFNLNFDDEGLTSAAGRAQSQLNKTVVTLPEGFTIDPSAGVGLAGCTPADYARETIESEPGAGCPNESKLGTVEIETPLLTQKIQGNIFIAQPYENPFSEPGHPNGSLVALYVVAKNPETGVMIKLAGKVEAGGQQGVEGLAPGQLRTTFENNPQLPFDHFNFHFREGVQAPLITPATCGTYTTTAALTPWSTLPGGTSSPTTALTDSSSFTITSGVGGGGPSTCPSGGAPPFNPGIEAGMLNNDAGAFSQFDLHLTRGDADQEISGFSTDMPPGLTGDLTGIPFCPEADIALARTKTGAQEEANPSCPEASQIGHTLVGTGVGAVLAYVPGKIYLAGPYNGAPFSIVSVTSAKVGPFDLGTVVLRFALNVNPYTAQVSVSPTASEPIPTILDGIVTHVRDIRVYIERPAGAPFTLNPTSCNAMSIGSTLTAPELEHKQASATISSPFQATNCASLKFAPKFVVSTSGKTSRANGASLHVDLTYPLGAAGTYANIAKVKVDLPKQLPSRLTTLQKACTAAQFNANPAGCPAASFIGHAKAVTPLIPVPLEGPAIFVSHGGEAFPSLIMVLQGYGVTIDLVGTTFISKQGITSSTFKTVPDQPVGSFELTLPEGKYSALAASGNLCTSKLTMPTEFVAQNGLKINETTKIAVTSCAKTKALTRAQKLKAALKACHKQKGGSRLGCEKTARKKYGALKKKARKK